MISNEALIVVLGLVGILLILAFDKMRPGFTLFSAAIIFMVMGVITPEELVAGFSNREMITVAMLFLIGEGVRQSGSLSLILKHVLPQKRRSVGILMAQILPVVSLFSMMLNNTAVVIIFAPIIKRWSERLGLPASKFLIPLSYATILGGLCTLIGTSTNMVVNGLMQQAGYRGFAMFELGRVGGIIAVVGLLYLFIFGGMLLPSRRGRTAEANEIEQQQKEGEDSERQEPWNVEVLLMARFPGMGLSMKDFNFYRHYGAKIVTIKRNGVPISYSMKDHVFSSGDTLCLSTDDMFVRTWRESSAFYILSGSDDDDDKSLAPHIRNRRWLGLILVVLMMIGATLGDKISEYTDGVRIDMFLLASVVMVVMALLKIFPAKRYTKFITWDILIAIAAAFAISRAMSNSGINDMIAVWMLGFHRDLGPYGVMMLLYLVTMLLTELITNSAAVAISFPIAVALSEQMGIDPRPMFVAICIAASASFSSPIGYQTNLIVQGVGGYKFKDYLRVGIWLNIITLLISVYLIPLIWPF